ncbi:MFS transporter [Raphidiopsis sp. BLCC-F218]
MKAIYTRQEEVQNPHRWLTVLGIGIGVFIFALDVYIVNLALPVMIESLHTNFATIQWVILSYLLAIAVFVLSASKLGDMWSKKRLYIAGLSVFTFSSLLCGIAPNVEILIVFRALQGLGAAFISGLGTAILVETFPQKERGLVLGIRAGIFGLGIMLGPTIGGVLIDLGDWPLIFLINVPIGIIACLIVAYLVPDNEISSEDQRFDLVGTLILTVTLTCLILGITMLQTQGLNSSLGVILLFISVICLAVFLAVESKISQPMLDLKIFQSLEFSLGLVLRFWGNFVMAGSIFMLPFFLELVKKYPTQKTGLLLAVPSIIIAITAPLSGILSDKFGSRNVSIIGLILMAIGCLSVSGFDKDLTVCGYILAIIPYGLGVGMFQSPNNSTIMSAAPSHSLGIASGLLSLSRILGQTVGVPLVGAIFSFTTITSADLSFSIDVTSAPVEALVLGTQITFRAVAGLLLLSTMSVICFWGLNKNFTNRFPLRLKRGMKEDI